MANLLGKQTTPPDLVESAEGPAARDAAPVAWRRRRRRSAAYTVETIRAAKRTEEPIK